MNSSDQSFERTSERNMQQSNFEGVRGMLTPGMQKLLHNSLSEGFQHSEGLFVHVSTAYLAMIENAARQKDPIDPLLPVPDPINPSVDTGRTDELIGILGAAMRVGCNILGSGMDPALNPANYYVQLSGPGGFIDQTFTRHPPVLST